MTLLLKKSVFSAHVRKSAVIYAIRFCVAKENKHSVDFVEDTAWQERF